MATNTSPLFSLMPLNSMLLGIKCSWDSGWMSHCFSVTFPHAFSLSTQVQSPCSEGQGLLWCIMNGPNTFLHSWRKLNVFMDLGHCCFSKGIPSRWFLVCICVSVGRCTCVWVPMHVCTHAYDSQRTNSGVLFLDVCISSVFWERVS